MATIRTQSISTIVRVVAIVTAIVMATGLIGTVIPFVPGLPLIWVAAFVYGLVEGFERTGIIAMALISILMVAGIATKYALAGRSARRSGAPTSTIFFASVLAFIGFFVIPIIGAVIGGIIGILLAERLRLGDWGTALSSTKAVTIALGVGVMLEIAAGLLMILCWVAWWMAA